ncbi:protein kinase, partial [Streptomyces sp. MCAF7]
MALPLTHDDPQQLGPFRLVARLGGGGMGTVYLGRSPSGRTVALKTMHERIASQATFRSRFQLEIDAARVMGERYGAEVVDADPFAAVPWLATEYVLGPPLDDTVALCGPLPERSVRALGAALCAALGQLHRSDVVHRDLKPSNILITAFGPKVIDFGIARAIGDQRLTSVGVTAGTPAFMSPEQAMGAEHTSAGDVFALAGVLIFAARGHGPFGSGQPADLLYRVRFAEPDLDGVPGRLLPILSRCLSKDPAHRPSMAELAGRLNHQEGESAEAEFTDYLPEPALAEIGRRATEVWQIQPTRMPAPPGSADEAAPRPGMSRRKLLTLSGGAVLGAAAAGVGTWAWLTQRGEHADTAGPRPTSTRRQARWTRKWDIWGAEKIRIAWQVVSDGEHAYAFIPENMPKEGLSIYSVNLKNGRPRRLVGPIRDLDGAHGAPAHALIAADGVIYLVARERNGDPSGETGWHELAADLRSGKELWRQPFKGAYSPDTPEDAIVAKAVGKRLVLTRRLGVLDIVDGIGGRDTRTGRMLWSWDLPRERLDSESYLGPGQLVADDDRVYFGTGQLYAFRLSDGDKAWTFGEGRDKDDIVKDTRPYGRPAVKDGVVYVAEGTSGLVALKAENGRLLWETSLGGVPRCGRGNQRTRRLEGRERQAAVGDESGRCTQ